MYNYTKLKVYYLLINSEYKNRKDVLSWIYLNVKSSPIFCITSAEDNLTLFPDLSVWVGKEKKISMLALAF